MLAQQIVSGLATGSLYALTAIGIVLIFRNTRTINLAQGDFSMIAKVSIEDQKICRVGFLPALINEKREPEPAPASTDQGKAVFEYMCDVTREAKLNGKFEIDGDEVVIKV